MKKLILMTLSFIILSCQQAPSNKSLQDFNPKLARKLVNEQGAILLDVRTEAEFKQKSLKNSHRIGVTDLPSKLEEVKNLTKGDKKKPIVVYCAAGVRAAKAKDILLEAGYGNVTNLGGIDDWIEKED